MFLTATATLANKKNVLYSEKTIKKYVLTENGKNIYFQSGLQVNCTLNIVINVIVLSRRLNCDRSLCNVYQTVWYKILNNLFSYRNFCIILILISSCIASINNSIRSGLLGCHVKTCRNWIKYNGKKNVSF